MDTGKGGSTLCGRYAGRSSITGICAPARKLGAAIEHCRDEVALKEVACHAPEWTTRDILRQLVPRCHQRMRMAGELQGSSIYEEGFAEGFSVGRLSVTREMCREVVYHWHPRAGKKVWSAIWNSTNLTVLREAACHAAEWTPRQILRRLTAR